MHSLRNISFRSLLLLLPFLVIVGACTVQKSKTAKPPLIKRLWHNTTAHYNGWFNANVLTQEAQVSLEAQHKDNYNKVLDVFPYVDVANPKAEAAKMDQAVEKVSVVVAMHRISQWTDDCYLQLGKAQFLKHDYESAQETLEYLSDTYDPNKKAKFRKKSGRTKSERKQIKKESDSRKKEKAKTQDEERKKKKKEVDTRNKAKQEAARQRKKDLEARNKAKKKGKKLPPIPKSNPEDALIELDSSAANMALRDSVAKANAPKKAKSKPDSYFLKHRPCFQEGQLLLAQTYVARQEFDKARKIYDALETEGSTFTDVRKATMAGKADMLLHQKKYAEAIPYVEKCVSLYKKKQGKARFAFILAQLYQRTGKGDSAYNAYAKVLKMRPTYEMEFNARLSMNIYAYKAGKGTPADALKALEKMSKDRKNVDYRDQVYFAMAQIELDQKNEPAAIGWLRKSLDFASEESVQRIEAFYTLARLFYKKDDFVQSFNYYDSTKTVMAEVDERRPEVDKFAGALKDIAKHLTAVQLQDSLIRIVALAPKEQRSWAAGVLETRRKAIGSTTADPAPKAGVRPSNLPVLPGALTTLPGSAGLPGTVPSNFFAYNPTTLQRGKKEFDKKWGNRVLEDNWRRKNKRGGSLDANQLDLAPQEVVTSEDEDINNVLAELPNSEEAMKATQDSIASALFALGVAFYDKLELFDPSLKYLDKLEQRYPEGKKELEAWYYQYLDYMAINNRAQAQVYADKIIKKYPETTLARSLKDPNFLENYRRDEQKLERYYEAAYTEFEKGSAQKAFDALQKMPALFKEMGVYKSRVALLEAFCIGKLKGLEPYKAALKDVVGKYENSDEAKRAREMLLILDGKELPKTTAGGPGKTETPLMSGTYIADPNKMHFAMVVLQKGANLEQTKIRLSDFNREFFKLDDLKVTNIALGTDGNNQLLIIRRFKTATEAVLYHQVVSLNAAKFIDASKTPHELFLISQDNYRTLLSTRNVEEYREFFESNYDVEL